MNAARSLKLAGLLVVATLAAGTLTACQSRVGAAAVVGSTRISESTVGNYVSLNATSSIDQSTGAVDNPKSEVLTSLIINALADRELQKQGAAPSQATLDKARTAALQQIGVASLSALEAAAEPAGFTKAYASLYLDESAKINIIENDLKDTDGSKLIAAFAALHVKVSVSPRYGDWQPSQLAVSSGPSVPSFLTLANPPSIETGDGTSG